MKKLALVLVVMAVLSFLFVNNLSAWEGGVQYEITQISTGSGSNHPDINNDGEIVWWDNAVMSNYRGMVSPYGAVYPSISNAGEIVWLQSVSGISNWQIFSNTRGQLTFGDPLELNLGSPKVNNFGEVVYTATDGSHYQVYSTIRGQITSNEVDHSYAAINDKGEIIWTEMKGEYYQVVSSVRGQLTFDSTSKFFLDLNNQGEFSYESTYQLSAPHVFSSRNGVVIPDAKQYQWYSGINDHGDIVFTSNVNAGRMEIFVARPLKSPILKVKANGSESAITITDRERLNVSIAVDPADYADENADWWLIMKAPNGYFSMTKSGWKKNVHVFKGAPLVSMTDKTVATIPRPLIGQYTFFFCVDTLMDGMLDLDVGRMFCDSAEVNVVRYEPRKPVVVAKNSKVGDQKVVAGSSNQVAASFISSATADVVIDKAYIYVMPASPMSLPTDLHNLNIWVDGVQQGVNIAAPGLLNKFSTNFAIRQGRAIIFDVRFDIKAGTPVGHSWTTKLYLVGHNVKTGQLFTTAIVSGQKVTVVKGEIEAYESFPTIPDYRIVTFGSQSDYMMEVNFNAVNDGSSPDRLKLSLNSWQAGCSTTGITVKYKDLNGNEQSQEASFEFSQSQNTAKAVFAGLNFYIPKNSIGSLKFYINFAEFQLSCGFSGVGVELTLDEFEATSTSTGERVTVKTKITSRPVYVYKTVPYISTSPVQQPLGNGIQLLNKTIIGANSAGSIDWNELSYEVEKSDEIAFSDVWLVDLSTGERIEGTATAIDLDAGPGHINGTITFLPAAPQRIMAGGQKEYHLFATISGVTSGSYITTWIGQHSRHEPPKPYDLVAGPYYTTFIWSDLSAFPHSEDTPDWNNSNRVKGLPTAKQTITR